MGLLWLLLTAWVSCCVIHGLHAGSLEEQYLEASDDAMSLLVGSLFGFRPCLDGSCTDSSVQGDEYPLTEGSVNEDFPAQNDEPQHTDIEFTSTDSSVDQCLTLRASTLKEIEAIENRHPGIKDIKLNVINNFLRSVSAYSTLKSDHCPPAKKLMDFMQLGVTYMRRHYSKSHGNMTCNYTSNVEDPNLEVHPGERMIAFEVEPTEEIIAEDNYDDQSQSDAMSLPMGSLYGFRPCLDESCTDSSVQSDEYPVSEGSAPEDIPVQNDEPQHTDIEFTSTDSSVEHCVPLRGRTLHKIEAIENRHPGIRDIKLNVIENFVRYTSQFSTRDSDYCDPTMKLLDFMYFAIEKVQKDHENFIGEFCRYTINVEDFKSEVDSNKRKVLTKRISIFKTHKDLPKTSLDYVSTESSTKEPCPVSGGEQNTTSPVDVSAVPCQEKTSHEIQPTDEIIPEDDYESPPYVGSVRGIPGVHYPNYSEVPITSFSCADKKYIPGFYADLETGCQVFHVCYEHRRESFLCPVGTVFNQPILACDYWYSSNCSLAPVYYEVNAKTEEATKEKEMDVAVEELINVLIESKRESVVKTTHEVNIMQFLPVKAKVSEYMRPEIKEQKALSTAKPEVIEVEEIASQIFDKMVSSASNVMSKVRDIVEKDSAPKLGKPVETKLTKNKLAAAMPIAKVDAVKTALPIIAAGKLSAAVPVAKVVAAKTVVPVAAKAKLTAAASIPVAKVAAGKAKLAAAVPAKKVVAKAAIPVVGKAKLLSAVPKVAAKASIPMLKTKMIASALPLAKSKLVAPVFKGKALKSAGVPFAKAKVVGLPLVKSKIAGSAPIVKAKLAKAAAISPLTKKALALGYMKLLKAKKLALMG